ncbi:MAG: hypothetical protein NTX82_07405, partial [Candidatus Parcubacteria bacterium]|nr:hypothetical protein [Candidatus Parcubacteria bacterium]
MKNTNSGLLKFLILVLLIEIASNPSAVLAATRIGTNISTGGTLTADGALKFSSGAVNNYILKTDASGNTAWISVGTALGNSDTDSLTQGTTNLYYDPADVDSRADARITLQAGVAGGLATLDGLGKISSGQLPAITITNVNVVADIAARDALTPVETGDVAIVLDEHPGLAVVSNTYIYDGTVWQEVKKPLNQYFAIANNLSELTSPSTARTNLGL